MALICESELRKSRLLECAARLLGLVLGLHPKF